MEDLELARRCNHDEAAREEVFVEHSNAVYRLALRLLGNRPDAEDVVQETFIEVFRSIKSYRGEASLRSWLHRITVRVAGHYRRKTRRKMPPLALVEDRASPGPPNPASQADTRKSLNCLYEILDKIADSRRDVFILHEIEGYSLPESAALLDISVTAAKKRVWRARHDLQRLARSNEVLASLLDRKGTE